ncbi:hypothetical protein C0J52_27833 [Blattella germanica]|nr:hypothetical protein C0J52_27833 [Blattella germanica]
MSLQPSKHSAIQLTCKKNKNISSNGHLQLEPEILSRSCMTRQQCTCSESSNYL